MLFCRRNLQRSTVLPPEHDCVDTLAIPGRHYDVWARLPRFGEREFHYCVEGWGFKRDRHYRWACLTKTNNQVTSNTYSSLSLSCKHRCIIESVYYNSRLAYIMWYWDKCTIIMIKTDNPFFTIHDIDDHERFQWWWGQLKNKKHISKYNNW